MIIRGFYAYDRAVTKFAKYPRMGKNLVYPTLGLVGEAGELAEKVKKLWRNYHVTSVDGAYKIKNLKRRTAALSLINEIYFEGGDVLWYLNAIFKLELKSSLVVVAGLNARKLADRNKRGVIKSQGDHR